MVLYTDKAYNFNTASENADYILINPIQAVFYETDWY